MTDRYGNRRVSKMLTEWNRLREAVREGNLEGIQDAFDACEEWIDFAFGQNKAVEALKRLADCVDDGCFCSEMAMATAMDTARATLAELTGGKDE
jgi:hypothetical protein